MSVTVSSLDEVRVATDREWDAVADGCEYATFFHTRAWAQLWERHSGGRLRARASLARFDDGVEAVLPGNVKTLLDLPWIDRLSGAFETILSSYGSHYGGWISTSELTPAHHRLLWQHYSTRNVLIMQNPFDVSFERAGLDWPRASFTQVVDLRPDLETLRGRWSRGHRSAVNKASRAGVEVARATTRAEWREYVELYRWSLQRWGDPISRYDDRVFDLFAEIPAATLWTARWDGRMLAGVLCLYHNRTIMYWSGALRIDEQRLRAAPLLHAEVMRAGKQAGYRWYDFNPSGDLDGVIAFKERFGAQRRDLGMVLNNAPLKARLLAVRNRLTGVRR